MSLLVHPYAARPGVDIDAEAWGAALRAALWDLFEASDYNTPDEIEEMFEALLTDIAIDQGWWQDADGRWYKPR